MSISMTVRMPYRSGQNNVLRGPVTYSKVLLLGDWRGTTDHPDGGDSRGRETTSKVTARESRCTGYEVSHRSATSVTGDPTRLSSPSRSSVRSEPTVKEREPMAL